MDAVEIENLVETLNSRAYQYGKAIVYRKKLQCAGITEGKLVDIHEPPYGDEDWDGPFLVTKIVRGGKVQVRGRRGHFSPYRVRLHVPKA